MSRFEEKQVAQQDSSRGESATAVLERPLDPLQSQDLDQEIHGSTIEISDISEILISNQAGQDAQAVDERDDLQHAQTQASEALAHHSPAPVALVGGVEVDHSTRQVREVVNQERIEDKVRRDAKALAVERKDEIDREGERLLPTPDSAIANEADKSGTSASTSASRQAQGDRISADRAQPDASQKTGIEDPREATRSKLKEGSEEAQPDQQIVLSPETRAVLEAGYQQSVKAAALDCALMSDYYDRPTSKTQSSAQVELIAARYGILGIDREKIEAELQKASRDIAADVAKLSKAAKEELRDELDSASFKLMRDPNYPSVEALQSAKSELAKNVSHSKGVSAKDVTIILKLFNQDGDTLMAAMAHGAALRSVPATQADLDYVKSFADKSNFQKALADTQESIALQLKDLDRLSANPFLSNKKIIDRLVDKIGKAGCSDSATDAEFGSLNKELCELERNLDSQTRQRVLPLVRALLAKAELRLQAVDSQYLDSHFTGDAEDRVVKNLGYLGVGDGEVESKLQSFARGANLLAAQRELKKIDEDYVKLDDHHYDSATKQFVVGAGSRTGRDVTRKGKRDEMSADAALALRHAGFEGPEMAEALSGFLGHVEGRYNQAKLGVESNALASVENLRKKGATAVELTGDLKAPVKISTEKAPEASGICKDFLSRYSALGAVEIDEDALEELKEGEIKAGRGESSVIVQQAVVTKAWFDAMKAKDDDFEADEANAEQLADLSRRIYLIGASPEEASKKLEVADFKKLNEIADLQQVVTTLSRRGQAIPYLSEAAQYFQGNLPQNEAERMLLEAKARETVKFCQGFIAKENENAKQRQYDRAGGWVGVSAWSTVETVDGFFDGLTAGWVSPKRWGMALNNATTGGANKDAYADLQGSYDNLDGAARIIAHGSRHVSEIGGMAVGAFYGAEALQAVKVAGVGLRVGGQAGRVALAMGAQQALKADDNFVHLFNEKGEVDLHFDASEARLGERAKAGGSAYVQGLLFSYGTQWLAKGAGAVGSKVMPQSVTSALEGTAVANVVQRGTEMVKQSATGTAYAGRMVVGAGVNVASDVGVALATGQEITTERLVDSAVFGAVFEGLGVHSQRAKAAKDAAPSVMEQVESFSPETHQKLLELHELSSQLAETQGPRKLKQVERPAVEAEVTRRTLELEAQLGPGRLQRALTAPITTTVQVVRESGGAIKDGALAVKDGVVAAKDATVQTVREIPGAIKDGAIAVKDGAVAAKDRVVAAGEATVQTVREIPGAIKDGAVAVKDGVVAAKDATVRAAKEIPGAVKEGAIAVKDGVVAAKDSTVEFVREMPGAIRDGAVALKDSAVKAGKDGVASVKSGVTSVKEGIVSEIRQIKVEYLTRNTDRSPQAIEAANKFLDLEGTLDKSPDAAARLKTLREMAVQNRTLRNEAALTDVRAELTNLGRSVLDRGVQGQARPGYEATNRLGETPRISGLVVNSNTGTNEVARELTAAELNASFSTESYKGPQTPESGGYVDPITAQLEAAFKADSYDGNATPESSGHVKTVDPEVAALQAQFDAPAFERKVASEPVVEVAVQSDSSMADFEASFKAESYKGDQTPEASAQQRESVTPEQFSDKVDRIPDTWDELFTKMESRSKPVEPGAAPESTVATTQEIAVESKPQISAKEQGRLETRQSELAETKNQLEGELYDLNKQHEFLADEYAQNENQQLIDELSKNLETVEKELARVDKKLSGAAKSSSKSSKPPTESTQTQDKESEIVEPSKSEPSRAELQEQAMDLGRKLSDARENMRSAQSAEEFKAAENELSAIEEQLEGIKGKLGAPKAKPVASDPVQDLRLDSNSDSDTGGDSGGKGGDDAKPEVEKPRWMREDSGSDWRSDSNGPDDGGGVALEQEVKVKRKLETLTKTEISEEAPVEEVRPEEPKPKEKAKVDPKQAAEELKKAAEERISKLSPEETLQEQVALEQQKTDLEQLQKELHRKLNKEADPIAKEKIREEIMKLSKTRKQTVVEIETIAERLAREVKPETIVKPEPKAAPREEVRTARAEPELEPMQARPRVQLASEPQLAPDSIAEPMVRPMPHPEAQAQPMAMPQPHPLPLSQARPIPFPKPVPLPLDQHLKQQTEQQTKTRRRDDDGSRRSNNWKPNEYYEDPEQPSSMGHWDSDYGTEGNKHWNPNQTERRNYSEKGYELGQRQVKRNGAAQGGSPLYDHKSHSGVVLNGESASDLLTGNSEYATVLEVTEVSRGAFINTEGYEG